MHCPHCAARIDEKARVENEHGTLKMIFNCKVCGINFEVLVTDQDGVGGAKVTIRELGCGD
jgi:transcription elongation factor Elf1